jgi:hypothetical protein
MSDQPPTTGSSEECIPCFIRKTYKILEDEQYTDIISWNEEGNAIIIKNPTEFAQSVLPTYFKHNNLNSFIRQLNMYDFHKKKTPEGEHVYYHDLFERGKKHLLKNIRRKNAESSTVASEKSKLGLDLVRTKQDIATIINENLLLKKINREAMTTLSTQEAKINELTLQNQALWAQILKYNEKEEILKSLVPSFKREASQYPLSTLDINTSKPPSDYSGSKIPQTTTRIPHFQSDLVNSRNWNLMSESFDGGNPPSYFNTTFNESKPLINTEDKRKRAQKTFAKTKNYSDPRLASDLSQQIVRNMDQELQYLKQLTSSNARPGGNLSLGNSPRDSGILGKRRIETDPVQSDLSPYEGFNKIYKPDPLLGINFISNPIKTEGQMEREECYGEEER